MPRKLSLKQVFTAATLAIAVPLAGAVTVLTGMGAYSYMGSETVLTATMETASGREPDSPWHPDDYIRLTAPALNGNVDHFCDAKTINTVALLVVDIQDEFCNSKGTRGTPQTELVAERAKSLVPEFRKASIPVYMIYYKLGPTDPNFHKVEASPRDILVAKDMDSAFTGSNIDTELRRRGHKILLVCGVNREYCVHDTVKDGVEKGYEVYVLSDMTGSGYHDDRIQAGLKRLKDEGAVITTSTDILRVIQNVNMLRNAAERPSLPAP